MTRVPRKLHKCLECPSLTNGKRCKPCNIKSRTIHQDRDRYRRFHATKKKYNIDELDFECLWIVFKGRCCICGNKLILPVKAIGQPLDVVTIDHDHVTGQIRGLLCGGCNKGIGYFHDNPVLLDKARRYCEKISVDPENP